MSDYDKNHVIFRLNPVEDRNASIEAGHPVYRDVEFIRITPPGGNLIVDREVTDTDKEIYGSRYNLWKEGVEEPIEGTHLSMWPGATPAMVKTLKEIHVYTVEALAGASEGVLGQIGMGARNLQLKAKTWLEGAESIGKVAEKIAALEAENEGLKTRNAELQVALDTLRGEIQKPRKGRPSSDIQELQELVA